MFFIAGYSLVSHTGNLYGYSADLNMIPNNDIGVFLALNGHDYNLLGRLLTQAFLLDLALDEEPWLNTTTVCTFPHPWSPWLPDDELMQTIASLDDGPAHRFTKIDQSSDFPYPSDLTPYTGVYGDFYYGNVTVFSDDSQSLFIHYGSFQPTRLVPTGNENFFFGVPDAYDWPVRIATVEFGFSEEGLTQYDLCMAEFDWPPTTFVRDLKKSDAPEPPNPNDCS